MTRRRAAPAFAEDTSRTVPDVPEAQPPYNPLDRVELGRSVERALLAQPLGPLPPSASFAGAGLYAIYYVGDFEAYRAITPPRRDTGDVPLYVGRAIPRGARAGAGGLLPTTTEPVLFQRLREHGRSIEQVERHADEAAQPNLRLSDFRCRYLVADDIWVPLGEALLIGHYQPVWNQLLQGFGNHDPGAGRRRCARPDWDEVHPGRPWVALHELPGRPIAASLAAINEQLSRLGRPDLDATPPLTPDIAAAIDDDPGGPQISTATETTSELEGGGD